MTAKLIVRNNGQNLRVWTGAAPEGTKGATPLTTEQAKALRKGINALDKQAFGKHQARLRSGQTVKASHNGQLAKLVKSVLASGQAPAPVVEKVTKPAPQQNNASDAKQAQLDALARGRETARKNREARKAQEQPEQPKAVVETKHGDVELQLANSKPSGTIRRYQDLSSGEQRIFDNLVSMEEYEEARAILMA